MLTLLRAACICLLSLQAAGADAAGAAGPFLELLGESSLEGGSGSGVLEDGRGGGYKNPITGGMGSGEISPPTPMKRRFDYAAADKSGLAQMGMDARLNGQNLTNFITSGGTAGSTTGGRLLITIQNYVTNPQNVAQTAASTAAQKVLSPSALSKKAEAGDANAQYYLGEMYYNGKGVTQDFAEAIKLFRLAAARGIPKAQFYLGTMYSMGRGVTQDDAAAVRWYQLAAAQGDLDAQYNLGEMYYEGKGVPQHYVRAHMWFNLAAASGYLLAIKYRDMVTKLMTPQEIAKAQEMALNCQQRKFKGCD